jgi:hypothetical protein
VRIAPADRVASEIEFEPDEHPSTCRCGVDISTADAGGPAVSCWHLPATDEYLCSEECAITAEAELRHLERLRDDEEYEHACWLAERGVTPLRNVR